MKIQGLTLLILVLATVCVGGPSRHARHAQDEKRALDLWQRAQKIPEGQNRKADIAREVISGFLKVERILPEGILASGSYGKPEFFKPKGAFVFGARRVYNFRADILVIGYESDVTDGDSFDSILFPCGKYEYGSQTLKRYATTLEKSWELLHPKDNVNAEIERLEADKRRIEARLLSCVRYKTNPEKNGARVKTKTRLTIKAEPRIGRHANVARERV